MCILCVCALLLISATHLPMTFSLFCANYKTNCELARGAHAQHVRTWIRPTSHRLMEDAKGGMSGRGEGGGGKPICVLDITQSQRRMPKCLQSLLLKRNCPEYGFRIVFVFFCFFVSFFPLSFFLSCLPCLLLLICALSFCEICYKCSRKGSE